MTGSFLYKCSVDILLAMPYTGDSNHRLITEVGMRLVEKRMVDAILENKPARMGNTAVTYRAGETRVTLHGNLIAIIHDDGTVRVTLSGWNTPTTRSRVNAILSVFGARAYRVRCIKGIAHITKVLGRAVNVAIPFYADAWLTISADGCLTSLGDAWEGL